MSKQDEQFTVVKVAVNKFGSVDVFINNAGIDQVETVEDIDPNDLEKIFNINVFGMVYGIQASAKQMKQQENGGKIRNACSIAGKSAFELLGAYSATKFAVSRVNSSICKRTGSIQY